MMDAAYGKRCGEVLRGEDGEVCGAI